MTATEDDIINQIRGLEEAMWKIKKAKQALERVLVELQSEFIEVKDGANDK